MLGVVVRLRHLGFLVEIYEEYHGRSLSEWRHVTADKWLSTTDEDSVFGEGGNELSATHGREDS
jgi:hypothetical protein